MQTMTSLHNRLHFVLHALLAVWLGAAAPAAAQRPEEPPPQPATAAPPPYSIPWQLRPAAIATVLRSDTTFAFHDNPVSGESGSTVASMLLGSYKLTDAFAPLVRLGVVQNSPPDRPMSPGSALNFINPVLGGTYMFKLSPDFRLALFLGVAVPVGGGGGDSPDPANAIANGAGILARSAMDNAMFAVNYLTVFPGVGLAYVNHGFTAQAELTLLQLLRVRGESHPAGADSSRTNLTMGLHLGYFFISQLSAGAELRHQRWLSTPASITADEDTLRDNSTVAIGLRAHFALNATIWLRPGLAYARAIDDPMDAAGYDIVQLDIPVAF
jgi:hypothetical protein